MTLGPGRQRVESSDVKVALDHAHDLTFSKICGALLSSLVLGPAAALLLPASLSAAQVVSPATEVTEPAPPVADPASAVTLDAILAKYVRALGGEDAMRRLKSRRMTGTYSIPTKGYTTTVELLAKAPSSLTFAMTGKHNSAARGCNGESAWSRDWSEEGVRELTGAELRAEKREAAFYREIELPRLYSKLTVAGSQELGKRKVNVVEATTPDGDSETMYFDAESGLLVRRDLKMYRGIGNVEVYFDNYAPFDGVQVPLTVRISRRDKPLMNIFAFDKVQQNVKIEDERFAEPADKRR